MNLIDVFIILGLGLGAVLGFKRGFFKQTAMFLGTILLFYLSFKFKEPVSIFLAKNLPFFKFEGLESLNVLLYDVLAFSLILAVLGIVFRIILVVTGLLEKFLKMTIILAIPSKILGAAVGFFQSYVIIYILLFVLSFPIFNITMVKESKYKDAILNKTPLLSKITEDAVKLFDNIVDLKGNNENNNEVMDKKIFDLIKNSGITAKEKLEELVKSGKIKFELEE